MTPAEHWESIRRLNRWPDTAEMREAFFRGMRHLLNELVLAIEADTIVPEEIATLAQRLHAESAAFMRDLLNAARKADAA